MDDNTSKTVTTIVGGLNGANGNLVLITILFVFSILCNLSISYFFINAAEKRSENDARQEENKMTKIDSIHKSLDDLTLRMELQSQKFDYMRCK